MGWLFGATNADKHGRAKCCDNCDCDARREAERNYKVGYKERVAEKESSLGVLSAVPDIPADTEPATRTIPENVGDLQETITKAVNEIPTARERFPDMCALAIRLARGIDKATELRDITSATRQLNSIMAELRKSCPVRKMAPTSVEQLSPQARFFADFEASAGKAAGQ